MSEHPKVNAAIVRLEAAIEIGAMSRNDSQSMDIARCQLGNLLSEIEQLEAENKKLRINYSELLYQVGD